MTAYYNEFEPFAAQWLRNLIDAGEIAPGVVDERSIEDVTPDDLISIQALPESNSFYPKAYGRLGTKPRPFQATSYLLKIVFVQVFRAQVGELFQSLSTLRSPRNEKGRQDSDGRTARSDCRGVFSLLSLLDIFPPFAGAARGRFGPTWHCSLCGRGPSIATCYAAHCLSGTIGRTLGNCVHCLRVAMGFSFSICLCILANNTSCEYVTPAFRCCIRRTLAA